MYSSKEFRLAPCPEANSYIQGKVRIQFLTDRFVRFEWQEHGIFEERQTLAVVNRNIMPVGFSVEKQGKTTTLKTGMMKVVFTDDGKPLSDSNLQVTFELNGQDICWKPGEQDDKNLGSTIRTLDCINGDQKWTTRTLETIPGKPQVKMQTQVDLGKGFISRSGWSFIDDSNNIVIDKVDGKKWITPRPDGKRQDWYLLAYGHDYKAALADAAKVFGAQPLPPRYTLGYWWSRYWAYSDSQIEELVRNFDRLNTPIDVMVIDMDWHLEGWTGYTWDKRYFPNPDEHLAWLHRNGVKATLNLHPADGVAKFEDQFEDMAKAMGVDTAKADKVEFDITDPKYMDNYFKILHHPDEKRGIDFWWMDWQQGESTSMPGLDTLPWINQLHWEDMENRPDRSGKRPLIFSRFGGYGAGRYTIGFSGDTYSTWESLAFQPYFTATASNVLYGYWSHDIGGHMPGAIDPELYARWIQYGVYSPILRTHTTKNPEAERRVWEYPAPYNEIMMDSIRYRYELVPYIYSENRKAFDSAISLCRPMYYNYPECEEAYNCKEQYMFGDAMLVAPVTSPVDPSSELAEVKVWLPEGEWFDTERGEMEQGGQTITRRYMINEVPVFVRPGTVIPSQVCPKRLDDKCYKNLVMTVYPGTSGSYSLYEDDGISTDYLKNKCAVIAMSHQIVDGVKEIKISGSKSTFEGYENNRSLQIRLEGSVPPAKVTVGSHTLDYVFRLDEAEEGWSYNGKSATTVIKLKSIDLNDGVTVKVTPRPEINADLAFGLKGMFNRLERVNIINTELTGCGIAHEKERLGQDLSHASRRISMTPATFAKEISRVRESIPELAVILDEIGHTGTHENFIPRIKASQVAIKLLQKSGYLG